MNMKKTKLVLNLLQGGAKSRAEIEEKHGMSTSAHAYVLEKKRLVSRRKENKRVVFELTEQGRQYLTKTE